MKKTRILSAILLVIFVAFAFASCAAYKGKDKTFTHGNVEITATDRFTMTPIDDRSFTLLAPLSGTVINITYVGQHGYNSLEDYIDAFIDELDYQVLGGSYQKVDGNYVIEFATNEDGTSICLYEVLLIDDLGNVWIASFGCEKDSYEEYRPHFEKWSKTIEFLN